MAVINDGVVFFPMLRRVRAVIFAAQLCPHDACPVVNMAHPRGSVSGNDLWRDQRCHFIATGPVYAPRMRGFLWNDEQAES